MPAKYPPEKKTHAELLYVQQGYDYDALSSVTGVSASQLRRWGNAGAWEEKRKSRGVSGIRIAGRFEEAANRLLDTAEEEKRPLTGKEINELVQLGALVERHNPVARFVSHALEALSMFGAYLREHAPHLLPEVAPRISDFGEQVVRSKLGS